MVDNKSKTSLIGHVQKKKSLMEINIIFVFCSRITLLSSFIYIFSVHVIREVFLLSLTLPHPVLPPLHRRLHPHHNCSLGHKSHTPGKWQ